MAFVTTNYSKKNENGVFINEEIKYRLIDFTNNKYGKLIPREDAKKFIKKFRDEVWENYTGEQKKVKNVSVLFNRRILSFLLAQEDCEGIRFYFAKNDDEEDTLVLIGTDTFGHDLGTDYSVSNQVHEINEGKKLCKSLYNDKSPQQSDIEDTLIAEIGGGNTFFDFGKDLTN